VREATERLSYREISPGVIRVDASGFESFLAVVFAQLETLARLYEAHGIYAMQPDGASPELQQHMSISLFVQGWLPMLDEAHAEALLARTNVKNEYVEADPITAGAATCGACGGDVAIMEGARRTVCEHCGRKLDVEGACLRCSGCGASLAPDEGVSSFACPHCAVAVQRVTMMTPV
jgi:predicted RNA-binding Zn-ribbon protein involved in translation (DUF1610 family)